MRPEEVAMNELALTRRHDWAFRGLKSLLHGISDALVPSSFFLNEVTPIGLTCLPGSVARSRSDQSLFF